jgi:hypothetical protein
MSQAGYTPISLYYSTTAAAVPTSGNLANGELAINITDGKLYYKSNAGVVTLLAGATAGPAGGSNTQVQFNSSGALAGSANMTFNGTTLTVNDLTDSSLTATRVVFAGTSGNLNDSASLTWNGSILTSSGFAGPLNGTVGATTANTGNFTTLTTSSTVTLNGGTANGVLYLNGSKVATSGTALIFTGTQMSVGTNTAAYGTLNIAKDTTTPYASLTITDEATPTNAVGIYLRANGTSPVGISTAGAPIAFYVGGPATTEAVRIDASGRFFVATSAVTSSSSQSGEVYSTGAVGFLFTNTTAANYPLSVKNQGTTGTRALINFYEGAGGGTARYNIALDTSNNLVIGPGSSLGAQINSTGEVAVRGGDNVDFTWLKLKSGMSAGNVKSINWEDTGGIALAKDSITFGGGIVTRNFGSFYNSGATTNNILSLNSLGGTFQNYSGHALTPVLYLNNGYGATGDTTACIRMNLNGSTGGGYLWGYDGDTEWTHNMEYVASTGNVARANTASQISQTGGVILFYTNTGTTAGSVFTPSERGRFPATGGFQSVTTISVGNAAPSSSGAGITFPATQSASSDANTLDDYEEGFFTATVAPSTSGTMTLNSGVDKLAYTKIGRVVYVQGLLEISSVSSPVGAVVYIQGLPFTTADLDEYAGRGGTAFMVNSIVTGINIFEGQTQVEANINASTLGSGNQFYVSFNYIAA